MVDLQTLGRTEISFGGVHLEPSSHRMFALVLHLCLEADQRVRRETLKEMLFPSSVGENGRHNLRQHLYRLRGLGFPLKGKADWITVARQDVRSDFVALLNPDLQSPELLERAARGFLPGYAPTISEQFTEWLDRRRADIETDLARALAARLEQLSATTEWDRLSLTARALLGIDPMNQIGALAYARALALTGSGAAAINLLDKYLTGVAESPPELRRSAIVLRRRISEHLSDFSPSLSEPPFFGRASQLQLLVSLAERARRGAQQFVLVLGEAGIGKSRILVEFCRLSALEGVAVHSLACQPHDAYRPMGAITDLVVQLINDPGALGCSPVAHSLLSGLTTSPTSRTREGATSADSPSYAAILSAVSDLVSAVAAEKPILIVIDDADRLDSSSLGALRVLIADRTNRRLMIVLASRQRHLTTDNGLRLEQLALLRLSSLDSTASERLLDNVLGEAASSSAEVRDRLLSLAHGNPLFIRMLGSAYRITRNLDAIPATVSDAIAQRLNELSSLATKVLEACVVLRKNATVHRVQQVLEIPNLDLLNALQEMEDRGLVAVSDVGSISCHDLLQEAVTRNMVRSVAQLLHRESARVLEGDDSAQSTTSLLWDCAEHWRRAGDHIRSAEVSLRCAKYALSIGRPGEAFEILERALSDPLPIRLRAAVVESGLTAAAQAGRWSRVAPLIADRDNIYLQLGSQTNKHDDFELLRADLAISSPREDPCSCLPLLNSCLRSQEASWSHRLKAARKLLMLAELQLDTRLADATERGIVDLRCRMEWASHVGLIYHTCFGSPSTAASIAHQISTHETGAESISLGERMNAGYALFRLGEIDEGEEILRDTHSRAASRKNFATVSNAAIFLADIYRVLGRSAEARWWLNAAGEAIVAAGEASYQGRYHLTQFNVAIEAGLLTEAAAALKNMGALPHSRMLAKPKLHVLASELLLRRALGNIACSSEELQQLLLGHMQGRNMGNHDEVMTAVYYSVSESRTREEAEALLRAYLLVYRRDRFPVSPLLKRAAGPRCT